MSIIVAKKALDNASEITDVSCLLIDLQTALVKKYPTVPVETINWALSQATMRTSLHVSHTFDASSTPKDLDT